MTSSILMACGSSEPASSFPSDYVRLYELKTDSSDSSTSSANGTDTAITYDGSSANFTNTTSTLVSKITIPMVSLNDFSICFWFKNTDAGNASVLGKNGVGTPYYGVNVVTGPSSNQIGMYINLGDYRSATTITPDTDWHHYVFKRSGTALSIYVDGVEHGSSISVTTYTMAVSLIGGYTTDASSSCINGSLSQIAIYNRAVTSTEIADIYNNKKGDFQP